MPEKLEFDQVILDARWQLNVAWLFDVQEISLNNSLSYSRVRNTVSDLINLGHSPALVGKISTEAGRYVRGEVF